MTLIKEYQYKERYKRLLCYLSVVIINFLFGFFVLKSAVTVKSLFFYSDMFRNLVLFYLALHLAGIVTGAILFGFLKKSRIPYLAVNFLLIVLFAGFIALIILVPDIQRIVAAYWIRKPLLPAAAAALIPFVTGIANNYYLKILSGQFFDERKGAHCFILFLVMALSGGAAAYILGEFYTIAPYFWGGALVLLAAASYFIKLEYTPVSFIAREFGEHHDQDSLNVQYRDNLIFNYLNFSYLVIFGILGSLIGMRFYGDFLFVKLAYAGIFFAAFILGFSVSFLIRRAYWHIYTQMLFPLFFIFYFIMLQRFSSLPFYYGLLFIFPLAFSLGLSLYHSIRSIMDETSQNKTYLVLNFSTFIIPIPVIIALSTVTFSNRLFFVFFYIIAFFNFVLPGIHLAQRKNTHYRKGLYFALLVLVVPMVILAHRYFEIKLDKSLFVQHTRNFETIYRANSNSDYFDFEEDIYFNNHKAMTISDMFMRNLRRSVFTLSFFIGEGGENVLFIDGIKKFVENKAYEIYPNAICLDYVPESKVDYNNPPVTGGKSVITFKGELLDFFHERTQRYRSIVDIPNMYDQNVNAFKFSPEYYMLLKQHLTADGEGIVMQILQPRYARPAFMNNARVALAKSFKYVVLLDYGDIAAFIATDSKSHFEVSSSKIERLRSLIQSDESYRFLFVDETHCLSYISVVQETSGSWIPVNYLTLMLTGEISPLQKGSMPESWLRKNDSVLNDPFYADDPQVSSALRQKFTDQNANIFNIKRAEFADCTDDYISESRHLSLLQQEASYNFDIRHYLQGIIGVKEKTYLALAEKYEASRAWSQACEVYLSILNLQSDSFEANYRLGMIYVTLQNFDEANRFLQRAMELQSDNPRVLYQMGVLLYARGDMLTAVGYLERAIQQKFDNPQIYLFLGLAYESLGRLNEAKQSLELASVKDPANQDIKSALVRVNKSIEDTQYQYEPVLKNNDREAEQGESVPLPVNRNARESRITDDELSKYSIAEKGEGSEYAEKYAKQPGAASADKKQEGFFDLFRDGQQ